MNRQPQTDPPLARSDVDPLLRGLGEAGTLLRAVDWKRTPLGAPKSWPSSLTTLLGVMQASRSPMWLAWGAELTFFCNDACLPLLGERGRGAIGRPANSAWDGVKPEVSARIADVIRSGEPLTDRGMLLLAARDGRCEETIQSFDYSPLRDEGGAIEGCLCIITDETEAQVSRRRWSLLRELRNDLAKSDRGSDAQLGMQACLSRAAHDVPFSILCPVSEAGDVSLGWAAGLSAAQVDALKSADVFRSWLSKARMGGSLIRLKDDFGAQSSCDRDSEKAAQGGPLTGARGSDGQTSENRGSETHDCASMGFLPPGPWGEAPAEALLVPIEHPGRPLPTAIFIAGLSPHRPFDDAYRSFIEMVVATIASSLWIMQARDEERRELDTLAELDRARTLLAAIVESSDDAILSKTLDGHITSWNAAAERIFGYTADEIIGRPITLLVPPERRSEERQILHRLRRGARVDRFETVRRTKDGRDIHLSMTVSPIFNRSGEIVGASNVAHDITARRLAQQTLNETQARLQLAARTGKVGVWDWEITNNKVSWSDSLYTIHGVNPQEFTGTVESFGALIHPEDRERVFAAIQAAVEGGAPYELEFRAVRPDGKTIWLFTNAVVVCEEERPVRMLGATLDVTHWREMEQAVRESEARFARFMNRLPGLAWIKDSDGRYVFINDAAERAFGKDRAEVMGKTDEEIFPPAKAAAFRANDREALCSESGVETIETLEESDGPHHSLVRKFPIPSQEGGPRLVGGIAIDISERVRAEATLKEAKEAAEAANLAKDRFLAVLSHELRTPLTPVLMTVGSLERDPTLSAALREDVAMMRRNVELEARLIDDLLDLSRIASGKLRLRLESVELNGVVRHVCDMGRSEAVEKRIRLSCDLDPLVGWVRGDSARLQQVVWNVLRNALKFTPDDGDILVSTRRGDEGKFRVVIRDTGIGLDPDSVSRIFSTFEQGDARITRQFGGLGLGLSISKALVELHGGSIRARSDGPGTGATFEIDFPEAPAPLPAPPPPPNVDAQRKGLQLLVVDDHTDTASVLARLLRALGHQATVAGGVSEALTIAESQRFDLIISDLGLPDGSGYELMQRIRGLHGVPGIAVSGYGMEQDIRRSRDAGFAEHLVKPISLPQLEQAIARTLSRARTDPWSGAVPRALPSTGA